MFYTYPASGAEIHLADEEEKHSEEEGEDGEGN